MSSTRPSTASLASLALLACMALSACAAPVRMRPDGVLELREALIMRPVVDNRGHTELADASGGSLLQTVARQAADTAAKNETVIDKARNEAGKARRTADRTAENVARTIGVSKEVIIGISIAAAAILLFLLCCCCCCCCK